jgi:cytochrome c553
MRPLTIAALAPTLLLAVAVAGAHAQQPAPAAAPAATAAAPAPKGDAARGKELAYTCRGCHGVGGYRNVYPHYHVPRIVGQSEAYLKAALSGYRDGTRKHPTMQAQAQSFSEKDIADLAAYLASLK